MLTTLRLNEYEAAAPPRPIGGVRPTQLRIQFPVLKRFIICVLPVPAGFLVHQARLGSLAFLGLFVGLLFYYGLKKDAAAYLSLVLGAIPLLALLRSGLIPYSSLVVILVSGLIWTLMGLRQFASFWKTTTLLWTLVLAVFYWWTSVLLVGDTAANLRSVEWAAAAACVFLLNSRRAYLATGLLGIAISTIASSVSLLQFGDSLYGDRLGMAVVDNVSLGNPILIGMPGALILLLTFAEGGKWLLLENRPFWRIALGVACGLFLFLSTSRGSWMFAVIGILLLAISDKGSRKPMLISLAALAGGLALLIASPRGKVAEHYLLKMFEPGRSVESITSGRSEQWAALPVFMSDSPVWGFGPGSGREVSWRYAGMNIPFHSLFLHIAAETGGIGLVVLAILLGLLARAGLRRRRLTGDIAPLLGTVGFLVMAMNVAALDAIGGIFVGLSFLGLGETNLFVESKTARPGGRAMQVHSRAPLALRGANPAMREGKL